ncbi:Uncharacterized protein pbN1_34560 [Aromatoleum bremense]|nr:Uncharacterized protein pbN1_34560 [Aromatoleum bremense]
MMHFACPLFGKCRRHRPFGVFALRVGVLQPRRAGPADRFAGPALPGQFLLPRCKTCLLKCTGRAGRSPQATARQASIDWHDFCGGTAGARWKRRNFPSQQEMP